MELLFQRREIVDGLIDGKAAGFKMAPPSHRRSEIEWGAVER